LQKRKKNKTKQKMELNKRTNTRKKEKHKTKIINLFHKTNPQNKSTKQMLLIVSKNNSKPTK